ncbi:hypothetical protein [Saccharothrix hoggarensis]|uniref:Apea-like HEPN domain-containing protein n=1 Tax=Saccharothrix hoggarensis TaxID=913853 RepID=A0ABW3QWZ4_9PSEU
MKSGRWELGSLPGPRGHVEALAEDLNAGLSCVWLFPDDLVDRGAADDLVELVGSHVETVRVPQPEVRRTSGQRGSARPSAPADDSLPSWARGGLGVFDWDESFHTVDVPTLESTSTVAERLLMVSDAVPADGEDPLAVLASSDWLRRKVVVVRAWDENDPDDVASVLTRVTAHAKAHGVPPEERTRVLVAATLGGLPVRLLDQVDPVTTRVHWWWSVCGRLDTAVVTTAARPRNARRGTVTRVDVRELVAAEVVVEVAGPDLLLAEGLASSWDGRMATLREQITAFTHEEEDLVPRALRRSRGSGERPGEELRPAWNAGFADVWDGQLRISPAVRGVIGTAVDLDNLVWRGQNRALMPLVDGWRARLEEKVRARASSAVLAEMGRDARGGPAGSERPGRATLELGVMAWAVSTSRIRLPQADRDLLFCLRDARNALSHLRPLDDQELDRLARAIPDESW